MNMKGIKQPQAQTDCEDSHSLFKIVTHFLCGLESGSCHFKPALQT